MKRNTYIFLLVVFVVLSFVIGVRYGEKVEKTNKAVDFFLSIPPTPSITPTPTISYAEYKSKKWGLKFKYPNYLEVKESTNSPEVLFKLK